MHSTANSNGIINGNAPLSSGLPSTPGEPEIVGESLKVREVLEQVEMVAPTDCAVLLQGETGTGKEVFAEVLHNRSLRRNRPLIRINCAAIPSGLLESELFGHERGAFTGALAQRQGRFEMADQGTLFLDEVGDMPLDLQPKLLRVLQEQQFERLGGTRSLRTNARVIAATHHNLEQMAEEGKFRVDLMYRLNVFPLKIPALREHAEDIPHLVRHFTTKYAAKFNKSIHTVPCTAIDSMVTYSWPGNVRQLQNFIERAVILSRGCVLEAPVHELTTASPEARPEPVTLRDVERAHIMRILEKTNGQLAGAATLLGIPRSTLFYRVRRLGITLPRRVKAAQRTENAARDNGHSPHYWEATPEKSSTS
ncbi:MAG TPA: sigma 54-interacting transcriptional regulator [Candidatus Acidoferrum sp.]|nr:sigma 54-interacting transcriptional regulator [Candidatus Acidoferrum sp.]